MENNDAFDYQADMRAVPPDPTKLHRGPAERERRRAAALLRQAVRIDKETLAQFRQLAADEQNCEQLINQALREWLAARGLREMLRAEIQLAVQQSLSVAPTHA